MMSSETSTEVQGLPRSPRADRSADTGFQPWQLFTLAGLIAAAAVAFYAGNEPHSVRIALILTILAAGSIGLGALRVLLPLTAGGRMRRPEIIGGRTRAALEREKSLALRSLKELEFDRAMGKVSEKDFQEMSLRLRGRAARILRQLDLGTGYRQEIEREIARRIAEVPPPGAVASALPGEATSSAPPGEVTSSAPPPAAARPACACGTPNDPDARFCKSCGARLEAA